MVVGVFLVLCWLGVVEFLFRVVLVVANEVEKCVIGAELLAD